MNELEFIMPGEIKETKKDKYYMALLTGRILKKTEC